MSPAKENKVQLRTNAGGRVEINLTHLTRKWMKYPMENLGLVIKVQIENNYERELEIGQVGTTEVFQSFHKGCRGWMTGLFQTPFLQINIQDGAWRSRVKRTTSRVCSEEFDPEVTQCCKWPLKIDFAEFGWDWVLSPKTYDADFCAGDCSLGDYCFVQQYLIWQYPHFFMISLCNAISCAQALCPSIPTQTWCRCRAPDSTAPRGRAAPPARCRPSTCSTSMPTRTSSRASCLTWRCRGADALDSEEILPVSHPDNGWYQPKFINAYGFWP